MAGERHDTAFVVGAILGGIGGAIVALFNAPQAGHRTRTRLIQQTDALAQRIADRSIDLQTRGRQATDRAAGTLGSLTSRTEAGLGAVPAPDPEPDDGEPIFTLPDPLEPDPVDPPPTAGADVAPVALPGVEIESDSLDDPGGAETIARGLGDRGPVSGSTGDG